MADPRYSVFLSHSSKGRDFVRELYRRLTRDGVSCGAVPFATNQRTVNRTG